MTFVFHVERDSWLLFAALSGSAILFVNLAHLDDVCTSLPRIVRLPVKLQSIFGCSRPRGSRIKKCLNGSVLPSVCRDRKVTTDSPSP